MCPTKCETYELILSTMEIDIICFIFDIFLYIFNIYHIVIYNYSLLFKIFKTCLETGNLSISYLIRIYLFNNKIRITLF